MLFSMLCHFYTTISVLEGLWKYERFLPEGPLLQIVRKKQREGREFLL